MLSPKDQLSQIPQMNQRISQRVKLIEYYMEQAEKMGGALKEISVKASGTQSPMADWVDKAIDLAGRYRARSRGVTRRTAVSVWHRFADNKPEIQTGS